MNDRATLEEMLTFVRGDDLKPQAEQGAHDDCVMALAIAYYIRPRQTMEVRRRDAREAVKWTKDMWEDWRRADNNGRRLLEQRWGRPKR